MQHCFVNKSPPFQQFFNSLLEDDLKLAVFNSMLLANGVTPLSRKNLLKSSADAAEKISRKYLPAFLAPPSYGAYYASVRGLREEVERQYFRLEDLPRLTDEEMENALGKFLVRYNNPNILSSKSTFFRDVNELFPSPQARKPAGTFPSPPGLHPAFFSPHLQIHQFFFNISPKFVAL